MPTIDGAADTKEPSRVGRVVRLPAGRRDRYSDMPQPSHDRTAEFPSLKPALQPLNIACHLITWLMEIELLAQKAVLTRKLPQTEWKDPANGWRLVAGFDTKGRLTHAFVHSRSALALRTTAEILTTIWARLSGEKSEVRVLDQDSDPTGEVAKRLLNAWVTVASEATVNGLRDRPPRQRGGALLIWDRSAT